MHVRITFNIVVCVALLLQAPWILAAESVVKMGATMSQTGKYAEFGIAGLQGLELFIQDVNGRGGAGGRQVKLVVYDDESDPATAARLYEKLIVEDQVKLLVGPYGTDLTLAATEVAERHGIPIVVTGTGMEIFQRGLRNVFGLYTPAPEIMHPILDLAREKGLSRIAMAYANNDAPTSIAAGVRSRAAQYGMELVLDQSYDRNGAQAAELKSLVARMAAAQPDVAIFGSYLDDSVALLEAAKAVGFAPDLMVFSYGPALDDFGFMVGRADAEGVMATSQWKTGEHMPGAFDFAFRFKEATGHSPSYPAAGAYASAQVVEGASRLAYVASGTRGSMDALREQLRTMNFTSLLGPYRVDDTGMQVAKPIFIIQWQDGERRLVYPDNLARTSLIYPFPSWAGR